MGSRAGLWVEKISSPTGIRSPDRPASSKSLSRPTSILCSDINFSVIHSMVLSEASSLRVKTSEFDYTQSLTGSTLRVNNTINLKTTIKHKYMELLLNTLCPEHN